MKSINLREDWESDDRGPHAEPLHVDRNGRAFLFTLQPGQSIRAHNVPSSTFFVMILKGQGIFTGGDGVERIIGPDTLLVFEPGEQHAVRALEHLVFIGFLHGAPGAQK